MYLVDSGNDKDAGKKVRQIPDKNGWHLTAILNIHSNADHRDKVKSIANRILSICEKPIHFEGILQEVFKGYGLSMNLEQHVLVGSTVRSYLSWLKDNGKLTAAFQDGVLLWQRV